MSAGRRRATGPATPSPLLAAPPLVGVVVATVVWVALVVLAVHLGRGGRWVLAVAVMVAAIGCLLAVFALVKQTWAVLHRRVAPRPPAGRRRR
jgi:hypothetical protein